MPSLRDSGNLRLGGAALTVLFLTFTGCATPTESIDPPITPRAGEGSGLALPQLTAIAAGGSGLVAVGADLKVVPANNGGTASIEPDADTALIVTSDAGLEWRRHALRVAGTLTGVAWGKGRYVAVGARRRPGTLTGPGSTTPIALVSPDGKTWQSGTAPAGIALGPAAFGNDRFVALGLRSADATPLALVSEDGSSWRVAATMPHWPHAITFGAGRFVVSGVNGALLSSTDGQGWHATRFERPLAISGLTYGEPGFIGYAFQPSDHPGSGPFAQVTSSDGVRWQLTSSTRSFGAVAVGNGRIVGADGSGLHTSTGGGDWRQTLAIPLPAHARALLWAGDRFFAVGQSIHRSQDGSVWSTSDVPLR